MFELKKNCEKSLWRLKFNEKDGGNWNLNRKHGLWILSKVKKNFYPGLFLDSIVESWIWRDHGGREFEVQEDEMLYFLS